MILFQHRHFQAVTFCGVDGNIIPCIGMSHDAHAWIGRQDSFQPLSSFRRSIRDDDLTGML